MNSIEGFSQEFKIFKKNLMLINASILSSLINTVYYEEVIITEITLLPGNSCTRYLKGNPGLR